MSGAAPGLARVAVIGVGLIGGSCALALKAARACAQVVGVGRDPANLRRALDLGVIDEAVGDVAHAARGADLVLIAAPVAQYPALFAALAPALGPAALLTDAGSTKGDVVSAARAALGRHLSRFVPAHPIAGSEASGAAAARADLFRDRRVVLTPLAETDPQAEARVAAMWQACGARVSRMSPEAHDAVFAAVSHLPHLLAYALVQDFAQRDNAAELFEFAGSGLRDFSRLAASQPEMWRDICLANRDALLAELDRYGARLGTLRAALDAGDGAALERAFAEARGMREAWLRGAGAG